MYYIYNFVFYSIIGYIFETLTAFIFHINSESGFMYGPYTIVYGIGLTLMFLLFKKFTKVKPDYKKIFYMFITAFISLMILEFIGGIMLKNIYHVKMWNYKKLPLNIGEFISVEVTTIWTIGSMLVYYYIKPITDKIIKKIPKTLFLGIFIIMIIDLIITSINAFI